MNLEQLDQLLLNWDKKINLVSQNLVELHGLLAYQRLMGISGFPQLVLTGRTQREVSPALETVNDLFNYFDLLINTINKAKEIRKQIPRFFGSEKKIQTIEELLLGASIQLGNQPIPLAQRDLLTAGQTETLLSPDQLLDIMSNAFKKAKNIVLEVESAWERLDSLFLDTEQKISSLKSLAISLEQNFLPSLEKVQQEIIKLRDQIERDPLGVKEEYQQKIEPLIKKIQLELAQIVQQRNEIEASFYLGKDYLNKLRELQQKANQDFLETQEKVTEYSSLQPPLPQAEIEALNQWLTRLENKFAEGLLKPVQIGLQNWMTKAKEYLTASEQISINNQIPLQQRQELRGRLEALKAKAAAKGKIEDEILTNLAQRGKILLYTQPTSLIQAANLVQEYEKRLNKI